LIDGRANIVPEGVSFAPRNFGGLFGFIAEQRF
jgi:hypothetical protein